MLGKIKTFGEKKEKEELNSDEIQSVMTLMAPSLKVQNEIGFGDKKYPAPGIGFYMDEDQYFDPNEYQIHIGGPGIVHMFHCKDDADFVSALNYIRGHEEQHVKSTASDPYGWGIRRAREVVLEDLSKRLEGRKRLFRNNADYDYFAHHVLPEDLHYPISDQMLTKVLANMENSLEDGRIERIRAARYPGFKAQRTLYRGIFWMDGKIPVEKDWDTIKEDPQEKLIAIMNCILMLATCQRYQNGFVGMYGGTEVWNIVQSVREEILDAVNASRTRDMARAFIRMVEKLVRPIEEAIRLTDEDVMMAKLLAAIVKSMIEEDPAAAKRSESEEETSGDGKESAPLGKSDLKKEDKESSEKGSGDKGSSDGEESDKDGSDTVSGVKDGKKPDLSSGSKLGDATDKAEGTSSEEQPDKGDSKNGGAEEKSSDSSPANPSDADFENTTPDKASIEKKDAPKKLEEAAKEEIEKKMQEAAAESRENADLDLGDVNRGNAHAASSRMKEIEDKEKALSNADVKEIIKGKWDFLELKRKYTVSDPLPATIAARGRTLRKKNERYFKSLNKPNVPYLNSGSLDTTRLAGLAMGDTDIFLRRGKSHHFDGCAYILIDNSGSMRGTKRREACKAAAIIEESFKGLFPFKIVAFDDNYEGVVHEVVKGWDEKLKNNCCWNFCLHGRDGMGNADAYDIAIAAKELLKRPEKNKLLVVLSDGQPTEASVEQTKAAIDAARKSGVLVSGIYFETGGIGPDADIFKHMYQKDYICTDTNGIDPALSSIFQKFSRM